MTALARRTSPAARQAVWPVLIVVGFVVAQYPQQMGLIPDEGAVQEFAAASTDPAFGDRAYAGRPHVAKHAADASGGEDRVERGGEVRATVADHELDPVCLVAEIHEEVAGLLGGPLPGGMQGDPRMRMRRVACLIMVKPGHDGPDQFEHHHDETGRCSRPG